jgi:uncharacterized protein YjcR
MPRQRSPDSVKAEQMFKAGTPLAEIGKQLGVPASTVRRWKATQNWDGEKPKKKSERSDSKKQKKKTSATRSKASARKRKQGGQPGNHNGCGAPEGNDRAKKHGAYSKVYWDVLDPDEVEIKDAMESDEEELYIQQITMFTIRERRIMKAINKYRRPDKNGKEQMLYISSITTSENIRKFSSDPELARQEKALYAERIQEKIDAKERLPGENQQRTTQTSATIDLIARLERELTSVQSQKTKAITALAQLRMEKQKLNGEHQGNDVVRAWADAVLNARRGSDG